MKLYFYLTAFFLLIPKVALASTFGGGLNAGFGIVPIPTMGIDGFYIMDDLHLGLNYSQGSLDLKSLAEESATSSDNTTIEKFDAKASYVGFELRYFYFLGFNVVAGLGQRNISFDYSISDSSGGLTSGLVEAKSTVSKLGIGTMGRFGVFYIGFDLVGVLTPLSSSISSSMSTTLPVSGSELDQLNSDMVKAGTDIGEASIPYLAIFSIGALL